MGNLIAIVVNSDVQQFGTFYGEILRTEGVASFEFLELSQITDLSPYQVILLPETPLTSSEISLLTDWVNAGGRLIAFRPDVGLADLLGLGPPEGEVSDGYLQVSRSRWGISGLPLQFHGFARLHQALEGTAVEGYLLRPDKGHRGYPALTMRSDIGGSGKAVAFMYDLARSIVWTRQGNPALIDQPPQLGRGTIGWGKAGNRASEFFVDFLDMDNYAIPQADEQQRLLVNLIYNMNNDNLPMPRFWYLPGGRRVAVLMTGDDHNADGTGEFFDTLKSPPHSPASGSVDNWTCARATSWMWSQVDGLSQLTHPGVAAQYVAEGFDIGPHVTIAGGCGDSPEPDLLSRFIAERADFTAAYGVAPASSNRSHCFCFPDWDSEPLAEQQVGIRLDANYTPYGLPGALNRLGRLNGSAMPMRFAAWDGQVLDIYQVVSDFDYEYFDEDVAILENGFDLLPPEEVLKEEMRQAFTGLLDGALGDDGFWGIVGTHYDYGWIYPKVSDGIRRKVQREVILEELAGRNEGAAIEDHIPMISAQQLVNWLDLRNSSQFTDLHFDGRTLTFHIVMDNSLPNPGLEAMIPCSANGKRLVKLTRSGRPVRIKRTSNIRTVPYAFFDAVPAGNYVAVYRGPRDNYGM